MKVVNQRKQRRQQERQDKKQHKNSRAQQKKSVPATHAKANSQVAAFKGKRKAPPSSTDPAKRPRVGIQNKFMEMIQAQADDGMISLSTTTKKGAGVKKLRSAEDDALKKLEANLGISKTNGRTKLNKEFENDGLGTDFADFLTSLDDLSKKIQGSDHSESGDDSFDSGDDGSGDDQDLQDEINMLATEDAGFLQGFDDLPTDDEDEVDDLAQYESDDEDMSDDEDEDVARNTKSNSQTTVEQDDSIDDDDTNSKPTDLKIEEDIYGRPKMAPSGSSEASRYVPPHLRVASTSNENLLREIRRRVNGQLNRLAESNMESIAMEFESIYRAHVRADVNRVLLETLLATCCHETQVMTQLITVNAALLGALFHSIGTEIVGFFVENFVQLFHKKLEALHQSRLATSDDDTPSKETSNLLLFITNLYGFETVHCTLVYDIFRYLSDSFTPIDVELLHLLLQHCGPSLRADDPNALSEMITSIQAKSATHEEKRVQFLLDLISNLKKQKAKSKGTSALSSDRFLHLRKWIGRVKTRVGHANNPLRVSLSELLAADAQGRWWIIGGTWVPPSQPTAKQEGTSRTSSLLRLAEKQRMNTDVRRAIFCAIMGSSDFIEAHDAVLKLGLKDKQEREIIRVLLHCCGKEAKYNPFYALLGSKFAQSDTRYKFTLQLAFWDIFKQMAEWKPRQVYNLGCLLASLLESDAMGLSCLKV
ncbi:hypothetical protein, variant [Aphanomyces astaci]|nr:hypothetical protein, variant [Aphanomyces astaci]ETV67856.1 hypothetical protein, variant [Aphanomyces astaci]|eukprot:XP_009842714.1 hypothetical protein, variant [Aphanomyces astaci]